MPLLRAARLRRKFAVAFAALVLLAVIAPLAHAQDYPSKPITLLVVLAAGGPSDTLARLTGGHVGCQFGKQMVVESIAGGTGPAMNDLVSQQIDVLCDQATTSVPQIKAGTVKAYALTNSARLPDLDVPSNVEAGMPALEATVWNGAYAPKGTPSNILDMWNAALQKFVADPAIVACFAATGTEQFPPEMRTRQAHAEFLREQMAFFETLFTAMNVTKREVK